MTLLTVDELARDLKVRKEDLVRELVTLGYDVDGPESRLEMEDPAALRAELGSILPQREVIEKRIRPTVIRRRVKREAAAAQAEGAGLPPEEESAAAPPPSLEPEPEPEPEIAVAPPPAPQPKAPEPVKKPARKVKKIQPARIIERPARPVAPPPAERVIAKVEVKETRGVDLRQPSREEAPAAPAPAPVTEPAPTPPPAGEAVAEAPREAASPAPTIAPPASAEEPQVAGDRRAEDDKGLKRKKKKERRMQPAQIIGRVELKKEPPATPAPPPAAAVATPPAPTAAPTPRRVEVQRPGPPGRQAPPARQVPSARPAPPAPEPPTGEARRQKKKKDKRGRDVTEEVKVDDRAPDVRRRKEVLLKDDLYEEGRRFGRLRTKGRKAKPRKTEITTPKAIKRRVKIPNAVTVGDLAHKMSVKASDVIRHLIVMGVTASINEGIDFDTATLVAAEFGFEAESSEQSEVALLPKIIKDTEQNLKSRSPVVTVMGHVDHGKTSLLDYIRSTRVTAQEAGGITQHIGAYKVKLDKGEIVFLDTPGHEAFTAMRARGAQVTDFVVLVVAADDGVKEQTREAINHARAAHVPIVVAVNKIDKPDADTDRVRRELSTMELIPEAWGGETLFAYVSAKTGDGIEEFLESILLQAEMMELRANPDKTGSGTIIEARLDKGKGPVATVLVREGTLKLGDPFVAGVHYGKVRAMLDHEGSNVSEAGPATPVEVHGFSGVPEAGEDFVVVDEDRIARQIGEQRYQKQRQREIGAPGPVSMEELLARMQERETKDLNLILKADVQGSVEALKEAVLGLSTSEVHVKVIHEGVGAVTESDVMLASASNALIVGFNVRPSLKASQLAEERHVDVRLYSVIYEVLEDVQKATANLLTPVEKETVQGRAEVRVLFSVPKIGNIAGCLVVSGKVTRSAPVRLLRDNVLIWEGRITSMKRFKDDIKEALEGYECGIALENYKDVKVGDVIESYIVELEAPKVA